jgi:hypothetical protein
VSGCDLSLRFSAAPGALSLARELDLEIGSFFITPPQLGFFGLGKIIKPAGVIGDRVNDSPIDAWHFTFSSWDLRGRYPLFGFETKAEEPFSVWLVGDGDLARFVKIAVSDPFKHAIILALWPEEKSHFPDSIALDSVHAEALCR